MVIRGHEFWRAVFARDTHALALADSHIPDALPMAGRLAVQVRRARAWHDVDHGTLSRPRANGSSDSSCNELAARVAGLASSGMIRMTPSVAISIVMRPA